MLNTIKYETGDLYRESYGNNTVDTIYNSGVRVRGIEGLEAEPSEANTYAWVAFRHGRMYCYAGRTQMNLCHRLMAPYHEQNVSGRALTLIRKATGHSYTASDLAFGSGDVVVIKSSKRNSSVEDEQRIINACWKFERDMAEQYGTRRGSLVYSLNAQGVDRFDGYDQKTYDELLAAFEGFVSTKKGLRGKARKAAAKARSYLKKFESVVAEKA